MSRLLNRLDERFLLLVSLPRNCPALARAAVEAGADAIKVHLNCHHFASGTTFGSWQAEREGLARILGSVEIPVGIVTGDQVQPGPEDTAALVAAGFDFWDLFVGDTPPRFLDLPMGRMVAVDPGWTPDLPGHLGALGVEVIEASIIPRTDYRTPLNLRDLTRYAALVQASPLPVIVPTQKAIRPEEVTHLQRVGVRGLAVGAVVTGLEEGTLREAVAAFRQALDRLPSRLSP